MLLDVCCCLQASQKHDILQECVNIDKKCNQIFFFSIRKADFFRI